MPTYRSTFADHIGMVTKAGDKFNFVGGLLATDEPSIIEILEERVTKYKDVKKISEEEAASILASATKTQSVEDKMNENTNGETTISPAALMDRIRMAQAAQNVQQVASQQLEAAATPVINPQAGIVSSATLEDAKPSQIGTKK